MNTLQDLFANRKTYLAAAGLVGLAVWQFSQKDYVGLTGTLVGLGTALGLKVQK